MLSLIPLPVNFITGSLSFTGTLFDDFKPIFFLIAGVAIGIGIWTAIIDSKENKEDNNKE